MTTSMKQKPKILLHSCCAICSTVALERLTPEYLVSIYYYNPNIHPQAEYDRRLNETKRLAASFGVQVMEGDYNPEDYFFAVKGLEKLGERSRRCKECFKLRLRATARLAAKDGYQAFTTTLTTSRFKKSDDVVSAAEEVALDMKVDFLAVNFKKQGGADRSIKLAREMGLYMQNYCGCIFSMEERLIRLQNRAK
ncbi:MAG: epoxyqueuosine reductase QueH [Deltaproteobacteria bacterium]|nr:epoxyqueuosine reductase QueH [Deltaproteobacteria bacterium]